MQLDKWHDLRNLFREEIITKESRMIHSLHDQWKQLIIGPLSKLKAGAVRPRLNLAIDALDECDENEISHVIKLLNDARVLQTIRLRYS